LPDLGRLHRRMHNKLLFLDGSVAIVYGRNRAHEYFMQQAGGNFLGLDTVAVGAVVPQMAAIFDRCGDSLAWYSRGAEGVEARHHEPTAGIWHRLTLEIFRHWIPEDLL
jgi:phosphatidylserine/phosphatidylglycerophosphate/cardiolipin synthase-like enzyme